MVVDALSISILNDFTMIGFLVGLPHNLDFVKHCAMLEWKEIGLMNVSYCSSGFFSLILMEKQGKT